MCRFSPDNEVVCTRSNFRPGKLKLRRRLSFVLEISYQATHFSTIFIKSVTTWGEKNTKYKLLDEQEKNWRGLVMPEGIERKRERERDIRLKQIFLLFSSLCAKYELQVQKKLFGWCWPWDRGYEGYFLWHKHLLPLPTKWHQPPSSHVSRLQVISFRSF